MKTCLYTWSSVFCAGLLVIRELRAAFAGARPAAIRLFAGGTAPENLTGTIRRFRPSHIILLDAADLGLKPGAARLIALPDIGGLSFGTHALPLNIMADYLVNSLACHISVIGIQPGPLAFALAPSRPVQQAARRIAQAIQRITKASLPRPRSATRKQIKRRRV